MTATVEFRDLIIERQQETSNRNGNNQNENGAGHGAGATIIASARAGGMAPGWSGDERRRTTQAAEHHCTTTPTLPSLPPSTQPKTSPSSLPSGSANQADRIPAHVTNPQPFGEGNNQPVPLVPFQQLAHANVLAGAQARTTNSHG
jgi:hypothetical protein